MKFAAIDIGSNAIRLLIENVFETPSGPIFHKDSLIRVPVRLGEEAFSDGNFSEEKIQMVVKTMIAMKHIIDVHKVVAYRVCATSAMRESANSNEIVQRVLEEAGMEIEIISGDKEGKTILELPLDQYGLDPKDYFLYIDVGGGSTELAFFGNNRLIGNRSFPIGTLRLLNDQVEDADWRQMQSWIKEVKPSSFDVHAIGVGGNINHVMKHYGTTGKNYLLTSTLKKVMNYIDGLSMGERVRTLGLKPDRADVIVPAMKIYIHVMKWASITKIYVPKQGLSDAMISELYHNWKKKVIVV